MADLNEDLEPLFDYRRVQPTNFVCVDDDESPVCAAKKRKKDLKPVIGKADDDVEVIEIVKRTDEEDDDDWLAPPPKVSVNPRKQHCEDKTVQKIRLRSEQLLQSFEKSANQVFLSTEDFKTKLPDDSAEESDPNVAVPLRETAKLVKPAERPKIVISVQGQDGLKPYRLYKDDKFEAFFKKYAERANLKLEELVFTFDGDKIGPKETPASLDMEDEDMIEVHSKKPLKK